MSFLSFFIVDADRQRQEVTPVTADQIGATNEAAYAGSGTSGLRGLLAGLYALQSTVFGAVTASPVANTVMDRLKTIGTNGTTTNTKLDTLHTDLGTAITDLTTLHGDVGTTLHADLGQLHIDLGAVATAAKQDDLATRLDTLHADLEALAAAGQSFKTATAITPGTPVTASDGVLIVATVAGDQSLKLGDGTSVIAVTVPIGPTLLKDISVVDAPAAGTTATATVYALTRG